MVCVNYKVVYVGLQKLHVLVAVVKQVKSKFHLFTT